jgi:RecB family endonuclease NucS
MKESDFESILERYPELIEEGLILEGRQVAIGRKHIDLLFHDRLGQKLIVELKRGGCLFGLYSGAV